MEYSNKNLENIEQAQEPKNNRKQFLAVLLLLFFAALSLSWYFILRSEQARTQSTVNPLSLNIHPQPSIIHRQEPIPSSKVLPTDYHIFQTFNNCGPAALSMALRFYGVNVSQAQLGNDLRPYQVAGGDNDDKSVTLDELGEKAKEYGFIPYHRPMGNPEIVKRFIANDMPVIARTLTKPNEDIGHYRIIKGYDETAGTFLQDDSLQNKNLTYTY